MFSQVLVAALAGASIVSAGCTASQRIADAELILKAYQDVSFDASLVDLSQLPIDPKAKVTIDTNGLSPISVAVDGKSTLQFLTSSTKVFTSVTGDFSDYPAEGKTTINAKVYLKALDTLTVPVPVNIDFAIYYNPVDCVIDAINALTNIPTTVAGIKIEPAILPLILNASPLIPAPVAPISLS